MKWIFGLIARIIFFLSLILLYKPSERHFYLLLATPKIISAALSPFLAIFGVLTGLISLVGRQYRSAAHALIGSSLLVYIVRSITKRHRGFEEAFGLGWRAHIPPELHRRMLTKRWTLLPSDPPHPFWERNIHIGTHIETGDPLLADLWQPAKDIQPSGLGIIYLHSSAWYYMDKDYGTRRFFRHLANQGHVILDVAYTLAPKAGLIDMQADVRRAIAWLKTHSDEFRVNPERIVLMGGSAGGHLALLVAYTPDHPELTPKDVVTDTSVRAVVSYYGLPDLKATCDYIRLHYPNPSTLESRIIHRLPNWFVGILKARRALPTYGEAVTLADSLPLFMGGTPEEIPHLYELGSPNTHVSPACPPTMLIQGEHDFAGMAPDVANLHHSLGRAGVKSVMVLLPYTEHCFDLILPKWSPATQAATYDVERFLGLMA